ncbi:MAG: hypothetical protein IJ074_12875 [Clostridia bacterium]|nr:hypothetical protein [Clostridia bacterium]
MYIEDQAECAQFIRLIHHAVGAYDAYLATQIKNLDTASFMSHYLDYLNNAENGFLIQYLDQYTNGVSTEVLLYKQLLLSTMNFAAKKIYDFL